MLTLENLNKVNNLPYEIKEIITDVTPKLVDHYSDSIVDMRLYGSYARGDFEEGSDIDIAVILDMAAQQIRAGDTELTEITSPYLLNNCVLVSVQCIPASLYNKYLNVHSFYRNINTEGVCLFDRTGA